LQTVLTQLEEVEENANPLVQSVQLVADEQDKQFAMHDVQDYIAK